MGREQGEQTTSRQGVGQGQLLVLGVLGSTFRQRQPSTHRAALLIPTGREEGAGREQGIRSRALGRGQEPSALRAAPLT